MQTTEIAEKMKAKMDRICPVFFVPLNIFVS